ncbi:hypothetical protein D049_1108B, partial [Vibrio parahaemolyticus VPTS-2010]
HPQRPTQVPF